MHGQAGNCLQERHLGGSLLEVTCNSCELVKGGAREVAQSQEVHKAKHSTKAVQDMQQALSPCLLPATLACSWCISSGRKESPSSGCSRTAADTAAAAARWTAGVP